MILFTIHLAGLVKLAARNANVVILRFLGNNYQLRGRKTYAVYSAKRGKKGYYNRRRRGKSTDGKLSLDNSAKPTLKRIPLIQSNGRAAQMVSPIIFLYLGRSRNVPLSLHRRFLPAEDMPMLLVASSMDRSPKPYNVS